MYDGEKYERQMTHCYTVSFTKHVHHNFIVSYAFIQTDILELINNNAISKEYSNSSLLYFLYRGMKHLCQQTFRAPCTSQPYTIHYI